VEHHESVAGPTGLGAGFPGLPQLLREAAQAITGAEARARAAEEQMGEAIRAAEERVRAAEARAKAAEELAQSLEKRASDAIRAADRRADLAEENARAAEASARAAEDWVMRIRRVLNEDP
jgi:ABC-type transporter Mla subunit MlaD